MDLHPFEQEAAPLGVLGLKITQGGELLAHRLWDDECRRNIYSASKSFTALAVGFALQEGFLTLEEPLTAAFPEELPGEVNENLAAATVRDLLTMRLGQAQPHLMGAERPLYREENWAKLSFSFPFVSRPGERFVYSNVGPYLAGLLVQRRAGMSLVDYLTPRLFRPLGIPRPTWETDPLGNTFGAGGLFLTLSELHRFGLFCLQRGRWEGAQLLDPAWIDACSRPQDGPGYGYLFWMGDAGSYRADGKYSQLAIVLPGRDAAVTVVAECRRQEDLLALLSREIFPQL